MQPRLFLGRFYQLWMSSGSVMGFYELHGGVGMLFMGFGGTIHDTKFTCIDLDLCTLIRKYQMKVLTVFPLFGPDKGYLVPLYY